MNKLPATWVHRVATSGRILVRGEAGVYVVKYLSKSSLAFRKPSSLIATDLALLMGLDIYPFS